MKKNLLLAIILLVAFLFHSNQHACAQSQLLSWAKGIGNSGSDFGYAIAADANGNVYVSGAFEDTVDFDPSAGTAELQAVGQQDIFIAKYDANGNFVWVRRVGGIGNDYTNAITLDAQGNLFITGVFESTVDFDPGVGVAKLDAVGKQDIFIGKYDANGNYGWVIPIGSNETDGSYGIALSSTGDVCVTGSFKNTADFDPGAGTANLISTGISGDIFIAKYTSAGTYTWAKSMGSTSSDYGRVITLDAAGNVYTGGDFSGTIDFDAGPGTSNLTALGSSDIFVTRYDANGNFVWAKNMGGAGSGLTITGIAIKMADMYITGRFFGAAADFDPGTGSAILTPNGPAGDVVIGKYTLNGSYVWAKSIGGTGNDISYGMVIHPSGNILITGASTGTVDFDPGAGTVNITGDGGFIASYNSNGEYVWAGKFGGVGMAVSSDATGSIYVTGFFRETVDLDPGTGVSNFTSNAQSADLFILKMRSSGAYISRTAENENLFLTYPNPAKNDLYLQGDITSVNIYSMDGQLFSLPIQEINQAKIHIDISALPAGVYQLQASGPQGSSCSKIIKNK